jgi:uncharacterized protein
VLTATAGAGEALLRPLRRVWDAVDQPWVLRELGHRPWPLPDDPWAMAQTWTRLLFAHWPLPPEILRPVVPEELPLDTFEGSAWLGVTPFEVRAHRLRGMAHVPGLTRFPELNVRTYTTVDGKPGIYFLSLDAGSSPAVAAARRAYRLPYFRARMSITPGPGGIDYRSERVSKDGEPAAFEGRYEPVGEPEPPPPGSLRHFLTERYCLYVLDARRRILRADIHHPPWPLQEARATIRRNTMATPFRIDLPPDPPLLHFSARQDVLIWPLQPARGSS